LFSLLLFARCFHVDVLRDVMRFLMIQLTPRTLDGLWLSWTRRLDRFRLYRYRLSDARILTIITALGNLPLGWSSMMMLPLGQRRPTTLCRLPSFYIVSLIDAFTDL
jgi:hypothetical protein